MDMFNQKLMKASEQLANCVPMTPEPNLREQFQRRRDKALQEVERLNELLELLDRNPDVQRIVELMGRGY